MSHIEDASSLDVAWYKSSASGVQSDCVELGVIDGAVVAVRDSKNPTGPALLLRREQARGLLSAAKANRWAEV